ncbi:hypothetical protein [Nocardioides sp. AN3]
MALGERCEPFIGLSLRTSLIDLGSKLSKVRRRTRDKKCNQEDPGLARRLPSD